MRRFVIAGALAAIGAAAIAIPASGAQSIVFHVDAVHNGSSHLNGRVLTFRSHLVRHGDRDDVIGHTKGRCRILSRRAAHCKVVYFLPNGKVKTDGRVLFHRERDRQPVIGGTRAYNGVGGKVIVEDARDHVTHLTFFLIK
jgi:hypothetical protein